MSAAGKAKVAFSWNGRFCSVVWPDDCQYAVYAMQPLDSKDLWPELASGSGIDLAWASSSAAFAVLHVPKVYSTSPTLTSNCKRHFQLNHASVAMVLVACR